MTAPWLTWWPRAAVVVLTLAALTAAVALPRPAHAETTVRFRLTITNLTDPDVPITHGAYVIHRTPNILWQPGTFASLALERIAEVGAASLAMNQFGAQPLVLVTESRGDSVSWEITAEPGDLFSFAQMLAPTNDAFIGVNSVPLFHGETPLSATFELIVWDGGTEQNAPVGSGFEGGQPDMIHLEENLDAGIPESKPVAAHEQFPGLQALFSVTPLIEHRTLPAHLNLIGWSGTTTTSAAFLDANPHVPWLFWWDAANAAWLVDSPALPPALRPQITLRRGDAVLIAVVGGDPIHIPL